MRTLVTLTGFAIVVLDRGFVYVGDVAIQDEMLVITQARNIRYWGTTKGLGELALGGPTSKTLLDDVGTVRAPLRALLQCIDTEPSKWQARI